MKLFFASGASSLAPHILLEKSGLSYTAEKVNLDKKTWKDGDFNQINPKSYVPVLITDSGITMTECAVILEYISEESNSLPTFEYKSKDYWQERMWLNYIATELHKNFISPFRKGNWLPNTEESKDLVWKRVYPRLEYIDKHLELNGPWLMGSRFSAADAYLFVMTNWVGRLEFGFENLPQLRSFDEQMRNQSSVRKVLLDEGAPHALVD